MAVGEIQYRNALPWGFVLLHVMLATAIWGLTVAIVYAPGARPRRCAASDVRHVVVRTRET